jgi:hypothetical protein
MIHLSIPKYLIQLKTKQKDSNKANMGIEEVACRPACQHVGAPNELGTVSYLFHPTRSEAFALIGCLSRLALKQGVVCANDDENNRKEKMNTHAHTWVKTMNKKPYCRDTVD